MPSYSPELIQTMRAALDEVMRKIPVYQATLETELNMAEFILKAAAAGHTSYEDLLAAASEQSQSGTPWSSVASRPTSKSMPPARGFGRF